MVAYTIIYFSAENIIHSYYICQRYVLVSLTFTSAALNSVFPT